MKASIILALLAVHPLAAQPLLPRVTAKTLAELQTMDPMITMVRPPADTKAARPEKPSILSQSTILKFGENWTIVPNGAVAFLPEGMKSRVGAAPGGTLLPWLEFLTLNQNWITTCEVSLGQAAGQDPVPTERSAFWRKQKKVVVAVYQGGPISLRMEDPSPILTKR